MANVSETVTSHVRHLPHDHGISVTDWFKDYYIGLHPTIIANYFIDGIRAVKKGRDCLYEQFVRGDQAPVKRRKYVATDARIRRIVESYSEQNITE